MLDNRAMKGIMTAPPEKRYKSFLNTITDLEEVWLLSSSDGFATFCENESIYVLVWPRKEYCENFIFQGETPISIEIHEFLKKCKNLENSVQFMVFPTELNAYVVTAEQLCFDIVSYLDQLE